MQTIDLTFFRRLVKLHPTMQVSTVVTMLEIYNTPNISIRDLSERLKIEQGVCQKRVSKLSKGYTRKETKPAPTVRGLELVVIYADVDDQRCVCLRLTKLGRSLVSDLIVLSPPLTDEGVQEL